MPRGCQIVKLAVVWWRGISYTGVGMLITIWLSIFWRREFEKPIIKCGSASSCLLTVALSVVSNTSKRYWNAPRDEALAWGT